MKIYAIIFWMAVGGFGVKAVEDMVIPRVEAGWNMVDESRVKYCRERSRKWYRKATFQVRNTYERCVRHEI